MDSTVRFALIIIKTGKLFAECDGYVDSREQEFIDRFVASLRENAIIDEQISKILREDMTEDHSLQTVVTETKAYLSQFNDTDKKNLASQLDTFVNELISADGIVADSEVRLYKEWSEAINS